MITNYYFFSAINAICTLLLLFCIYRFDDTNLENYIASLKIYNDTKAKIKTNLNNKNVHVIKKMKVLTLLEQLITYFEATLYSFFVTKESFVTYTVLSHIKNFAACFVGDMSAWVAAKIILAKILSKICFGFLILSAIALYLLKYMDYLRTWIFFLLGIMILGFLCYLPVDNIKHELKINQKSINRDLPDITIKLIMLLNAGLNLQDSLSEVIPQLSIPAKKILNQYKNQLMFGNAITNINLQQRNSIITKDFHKLLNILEQCSLVGEMHLQKQLKSFYRDLKSNRILEMKQKGQIGSSQLLVPLLLIFIGIMFLVLTPVFMSFI